jgi:uncharacterized protein (TIGR02300 family)
MKNFASGKGAKALGACGVFAFDSGRRPWQGSRRLSPKPPFQEVAALANPALGAKQVCPNCSAKFYDLNRLPAVCPKCATEFDPEEALRNRRVRTRAPLPDDEPETPAVAEKETEEEFEADGEETPELDEAAEAEPVDTGEDEDDGEAAAPAAGDDAAGVDFTEDEDLEESDDDVPFIEDDDDDFSEDEIDGLPDEGSNED